MIGEKKLKMILQLLTKHDEGTKEYSAPDVLVSDCKQVNEYSLTGGEEEQLKMNDCYYDNKDWRACRKEVSYLCTVDSPTCLFSASVTGLRVDA